MFDDFDLIELDLMIHVDRTVGAVAQQVFCATSRVFDSRMEQIFYVIGGQTIIRTG